MATPTLALIPSGYGTNKVYSVLPSDGSGDFTFGRTGTATRINKDKLIESVGSNIPRLDYTDSGCPSLLLEAQRTNFVIKSNDFSALSGGFVTPNYGTSPEGLSVSRILFTAPNQSMSANTSLATNVVCNFSAYVKGVQGEFIKFAVGGVDVAHTFSGEWERLSASRTSINSSWNLNTYGGATARDFLLCGVQLEQGSYPTSYIPNYGESAGVTRLAETANSSGNASTFNDSEGVFMMEGALLSELINDARISISDGSSVENRITFRYLDDNELSVQTGFTNGFSETVTLNSIEDYNKIALVYNSLNASIFVNGFKVATNTMSALSGLSQLQFNRFGGTANDFHGNVKQLQYFNTTLTDLELQTLTSFTSFNAMALALNYTIY